MFVNFLFISDHVLLLVVGVSNIDTTPRFVLPMGITSSQKYVVSSILAPLFELTGSKKNARWCKAAFDKACTTIIKEAILYYLDFCKAFETHNNANRDFKLGAMILHDGNPLTCYARNKLYGSSCTTKMQPAKRIGTQWLWPSASNQRGWNIELVYY